MTATAERLVEVWRGDFRESVHRGHVAIWQADTGLIGAIGDVDRPMLPRSSSKMIQALSLVETGAADAFGLSTRHLALSCASHNGAAIHTDLVDTWLTDLGLGEADYRCGPQWPDDIDARDALIRAHRVPDQRHNNCSGKHAGFLCVTRHLGEGPEYIDPDHPLQVRVRTCFEEVTDAPCPGFAIDGCSAPNFASSLSGLARAMATFAAATHGASVRETAMTRLRNAMMAHPELVAGEGRACTELMRAMNGRAAIKTGAEGVFVAIIPERRIGVALKIADGATRAAEASIAHLLTQIGVLDVADPMARKYAHGPIRNRREIETGSYRIAQPLASLHV